MPLTLLKLFILPQNHLLLLFLIEISQSKDSPNEILIQTLIHKQLMINASKECKLEVIKFFFWDVYCVLIVSIEEESLSLIIDNEELFIEFASKNNGGSKKTKF